MRSVRPVGYALLSLAATACIVACASRGGGSALPALPGGGLENPQQAVAQLPARDLGRRASNRRVDAVIALRFNDAAALERLANDVSDPRSARFRQFLTPPEFAARFAPTAAQERRVLDALRRAGFTIERTYANRLLIDASAPSATVERFFSTHIHDFAQPAHGVRFANVTPARVPSDIAALVASVELNSLVYARAAGAAQDAPDDVPDSDGPDARTDVVVNGGFEAKMKGWESCGKSAPKITAQHPFAGRYDALAGSLTTKAGDVKGWSAICQLVKIPNGAKLHAQLWGETDNPSIDDSYQAVGLMNAKHEVVVVLRKSASNRARWIAMNVNLSKYAGRELYLFFGVHGKGQKKFYDMQYVDAVRLTGMVAPPTPTPSPTPTSSPTTSPTPTAKPTPTPTPTPTPGPVGPGKDAPLTGPFFGPSKGWAPRSVAVGFDFPVQHGYAGKGVTVGIVIDQEANAADLTSFYTYNKIAKHGKVTYEPVGQATPLTNDPTEATLDIESVAGLAPDANVVVYLTRDLSNQSVLAAYNQALSDATVSVLNSSFGECESEDANFVATSERLATAGAVMGITFVAAAGDEGSACYNGTTNAIGVNAPASGPHFLAVGGSQSLTSGPVANPAVWNDRTSETGVGIGGGGVSTTWPLPSYQVGLAGTPKSAKMRNVPDIALPATQDDLFVSGGNQLAEGTSWSSSIATALLASGEQFCGKLGWVNPAMYSIYAATGETPYFLDVTSGFNGGYTNALGKGYSATAGYDNASGIGMPNGIKFAAKLCGRNTTLIRRLLAGDE